MLNAHLFCVVEILIHYIIAGIVPLIVRLMEKDVYGYFMLRFIEKNV